MAQILFVSGRAWAITKNLSTLVVLLLLLPFNLLAVIVAAIANIFKDKNQQQSTPIEPKRILITGAKMTKALHLARSFHRDGHQG